MDLPHFPSAAQAREPLCTAFLESPRYIHSFLPPWLGWELNEYRDDPRHDEDLREPLVRRQGSQVSIRVARGLLAEQAVVRTSLPQGHTRPAGGGQREGLLGCRDNGIRVRNGEEA